MAEKAEVIVKQLTELGDFIDYQADIIVIPVAIQGMYSKEMGKLLSGEYYHAAEAIKKQGKRGVLFVNGERLVVLRSERSILIAAALKEDSSDTEVELPFLEDAMTALPDMVQRLEGRTVTILPLGSEDGGDWKTCKKPIMAAAKRMKGCTVTIWEPPQQTDSPK